MAKEYATTIYSVTLGQLTAANRGQLSQGFKRVIWKATSSAKSLILIEDLDLIFPRHNQDTHDMGLVAIFNSVIQDNKVMMIATTQRPDQISPNIRALFQDEIHLQIPTPEERFYIMKHLYQQTFYSNTHLKEKDIRSLSSRAHAFVAADLAQWCRLAEEDALLKSMDQGKIGAK